MRRCQLPLAGAALVLTAVLGAGCPPSSETPSGQTRPSSFHAPQGIAASEEFVLVANSGFRFDPQGRADYGPGSVTIIERRSRRVVGEVAVTGLNPERIAVRGARAYVLCAGRVSFDSRGPATVSSDGSLDVLDLSSGPPSRVMASIPLLRNASDPRVGAYGSLSLSTDGRTAVLGSDTRGDLFLVDLEQLKVVRGADHPLEVFPTPAGMNGLTTALFHGKSLAAVDFNSDGLCLASSAGGDLSSQLAKDAIPWRCGSVGVNRDLLEGPRDLAPLSEDVFLVLMSISNRVYRVRVGLESFSVDYDFAETGLSSNRLAVHGGFAYVVNSVSNNLQRVELATGRSDRPFAVLPVRSNPYDLVITEEPEGEVAWVTLQGSDQLAVIKLATGEVLRLLPDSEPLEAGVVRIDGSTATDSGGGSCSSPTEPIVGVGQIVRATYGEGGGGGQQLLPGVIQGAPAGGSSTDDVLSLGSGGEIVLDFGPYEIVDGPGPDFIVFENPFLTGPFRPFAEPAIVGVSPAGAEGADFVDFPCDLTRTEGDAATQTWPFPGCAGVRPVLAGKGSCLSAADPKVAGGDAFDLADVKLTRARHLRLRDAAMSTMGGATSSGFDLDAVVLVHYAKKQD